MGVGKYKYYFRKPKSEIAKDIFSWLLAGGMVAIAATSPFFVVNLIRGFKKWKKHPLRKVSDTFYQLKKRGLINIEKRNHQIYISLTPEGKKRAGRFQIDSLKIKRPKRWDKKWRIIIFDIQHKQRVKREALRGFLKNLGFYQLQKSVWTHPFNCKAEVELLQEFFGLSEHDFRLIIADSIGDDGQLQNMFKLY